MKSLNHKNVQRLQENETVYTILILNSITVPDIYHVYKLLPLWHPEKDSCYTSAGALFIYDGIIRPVVSFSALAWLF